MCATGSDDERNKIMDWCLQRSKEAVSLGEHDFWKSFDEERRIIEQRRFKLQDWKILIIPGLLGVGASQLVTDTGQIPTAALFVAPLLALLFDVMHISSTLSLHLIRAYLILHGSDEDRRWYEFPRYSQPKFAKWAAYAFTILTFVAPVVLAAVVDINSNSGKYPWDLKRAGILFFWGLFLGIVWCCCRGWETKTKNEIKQRAEQEN